jgi:hypothetical protein
MSSDQDMNQGHPECEVLDCDQCVSYVYLKQDVPPHVQQYPK